MVDRRSRQPGPRGRHARCGRGGQRQRQRVPVVSVAGPNPKFSRPGLTCFPLPLLRPQLSCIDTSRKTERRSSDNALASCCHRTSAATVAEFASLEMALVASASCAARARAVADHDAHAAASSRWSRWPSPRLSAARSLRLPIAASAQLDHAAARVGGKAQNSETCDGTWNVSSGGRRDVWRKSKGCCVLRFETIRGGVSRVL